MVAENTGRDSLLTAQVWDERAEQTVRVLMILLGLDDEPEEGFAMTICDAARGDLEAAKELRSVLRWELGVPFARHALRYRREARVLDEHRREQLARRQAWRTDLGDV